MMDYTLEDVIEEQKLTEEEEKLLHTIYERVEIFEQMNREDHSEAKECRQILHMKDPGQDDPETVAKNGKQTLQLQTLKSTINNVVADQMLSMPEVRTLPETPELQQQADDVQDLCHHVIYNVNDFENTHYRRCEDFYATGTAVIQTAWDDTMAYGKGDIAIIRWPIEAFLWDPLAENIQDARAVMKVSWHPLSWYREHFERGKFVSCDNNLHNNVGKTEGQLGSEHMNDEERALLIEYWWREFDLKTNRYKINVAYAAGEALLEVRKDVYAHGMYPFNIDVHDSKEGSMTGDGLVRELVNMMRYINRYAAYADRNARKSSSGRLLVNSQAGVDMEALADMDNEIIECQKVDAQAMQWIQSEPFPPTILNLLTMMQSDLKADSGANQFTRGETTGGIVSGKAINSLIQAGGKIASMRTEQLKYGFKNIVEQIIWLMAQFYTDDRVVMVTGRNGEKRAINTKYLFGKKLNGAVNPPPYTVQIEIASRDPQRVANTNQMFMEAFTMAAQTPYPMRLSDLFRILNLDGKDRILPVVEANERYQEQMQQLQQQLEEMQMQMQQMQEENVSLRKEANDSTNALAEISSQRGNNVIPGQTVAQPGGDNTMSAIVNNARSNLGQPVLPE